MLKKLCAVVLALILSLSSISAFAKATFKENAVTAMGLYARRLCQYCTRNNLTSVVRQSANAVTVPHEGQYDILCSMGMLQCNENLEINKLSYRFLPLDATDEQLDEYNANLFAIISALEISDVDEVGLPLLYKAGVASASNAVDAAVGIYIDDMGPVIDENVEYMIENPYTDVLIYAGNYDWYSFFSEGRDGYSSAIMIAALARDE